MVGVLIFRITLSSLSAFCIMVGVDEKSCILNFSLFKFHLEFQLKVAFYTVSVKCRTVFQGFNSCT